MVSASTPSANEPAKDLILIHTVQLKQMIKAQASASVQSEKTRLKKLMKMIIIIIVIMDKSQEIMVFSGRQKLTSAMSQKSDGRL